MGLVIIAKFNCSIEAVVGCSIEIQTGVLAANGLAKCLGIQPGITSKHPVQMAAAPAYLVRQLLDLEVPPSLVY